jgi:pimeloyl-ACP methyl ester carboxylesterase
VTPAAAAGAVPVGIFQHGLGRAKEDGFYFANTYAAAGWATVLMDLPFHGMRASDLVNNATNVPCLANAPDPDMVQCAADGTCTNGCDGTRDASASGFLSANVFASRDNFRQATVDHLTLLRTLQAEGTMNGQLAFLDGTRIGYAGQSLGAITGGNLAAYAPELRAAALNVGGGGLTNLLLTTVPQISAPLFAALEQAGVCQFVREGDPTSGCRPTPAFRQFLVLAQTALDPGDPLATSIGVLRPHNGAQPIGADKMLIQMAIPDPVVPNGTSRALANAYGFSLTDNSATSRFQTYDFGTATPGNCHGFILAPLERCGGQDQAPGIGRVTAAICTTLGAQQQAVRFIGSGGSMIGSRIGTLPPGLPLSCN